MSIRTIKQLLAAGCDIALVNDRGFFTRVTQVGLGELGVYGDNGRYYSAMTMEVENIRFYTVK